MLSFIIIGMNEDKTIKLTVESIYSYLHYNNIENYEIIYVDSKSTDNSIDIVRKFKEVKIFQITGKMNAAIARNIGANESKGDVLIFLDADMEIQKEFHKEVFDENTKLLYPFVSGQLKNIFYTSEWKRVDENVLFKNLKEDTFYPTTGGYFIIKRDLWYSVDGMKTKYKRSQDLDLGLRLAKKGTLLLRKKKLLIKHHTIDYQNNARMWKMLFDGSYLYSTSLLYREHFFNKYIYKLLLRKDYAMLILILSILFPVYGSLLIIIYFLIVTGRTVLQNQVQGNANFLEKFLFTISKDIMTIVGFLFFFPKGKLLKYKKIK